VCTMCALRDPRKFSHDQREHAELNSLQLAGGCFAGE
jgi:hypothetical protein